MASHTIIQISIQLSILQLLKLTKSTYISRDKMLKANKFNFLNMSLLSWENSTPRKLDIRNLTLMSSTIVMLAHLSQLTSMVLYSLYDWVTQRKNAEFGSWVGQMAQKKKKKNWVCPLASIHDRGFLGAGFKITLPWALLRPIF